MAGIINSAAQPAMQPSASPPMADAMPTAQSAPQAASTGSSGISDPTLQKIQSGIDAKITPQLKKQYLSITVAGMKVILSPQFSQRIMQKLQSSQNIVADVSAGVANIIATIYNEVGKNMAPQDQQTFVAAAGPAAVSLMCHILDIAEKSIGTKITPDMAAQCAQATVMAVMQKFGIDQGKMQQAVNAGQQQQGAAPRGVLGTPQHQSYPVVGNAVNLVGGA